MAIAIRDEADLPSGHKRKKRGDIIAIKRYPWAWGPGELREYLIVNLELPNVAASKIHRVISTHLQGGAWQQLPPKLSLAKIPTENKRVFSIPHTMIQTRFPALYASVDWPRVMDPEDDYQPWLDRVFDLTVSQASFLYSKVKARLLTNADFAEDLT